MPKLCAYQISHFQPAPPVSVEPIEPPHEPPEPPEPPEPSEPPVPAPPTPHHGPCVPFKLYEEALAEIDTLKKKLKKITQGEYRQMRKVEYYKNMAAKGKTGQVLSKKARNQIVKDSLASQYSEGVVNRIVGNKKKSHKYSNKGLHMSISFLKFNIMQSYINGFQH